MISKVDTKSHPLDRFLNEVSEFELNRLLPRTTPATLQTLSYYNYSIINKHLHKKGIVREKSKHKTKPTDEQKQNACKELQSLYEWIKKIKTK